MSQALLAGGVALLFSIVHVLGARLRVLWQVPRSVWLSAAGGVSVAYVFVHLLPELASHQAELADVRGVLGSLQRHVYLLALAGLALFYGLDRMARRSARQARARGRQRGADGVFWIHVASFAVYNAMIGYLLVHREDTTVGGLLTYAAAMGLHFVVNDQGLREHHGPVYDRQARWLLAAAPLLGWAAGLAWAAPDAAIAVLFALLAGGVVLNVLKEELPEDRDSRFSAFALGAALYAALLMLAA